MRFGSLFSGIGGLDLGLERAGMECAWHVEIDEFCRNVLAAHWPTVPRMGDVRLLDVRELESVDLIAGGFPCQPSSKGGARLGTSDPRWLWPEFARVLGYLRPRWALVENVPGILTVNGGRAFSEILGDLAALGYAAEWDCLPARVFGAPHQRDRLFLVAHADGDGQLFVPLPPLPVERYRSAQPAADPGAWWASEPDVGRVVHGIPTELDERRIARLGTAVVPQVAEYIGRRLMETQKAGNAS